ncbi:MAG TPA: tetratricopeptide repeat protein [Anaerolineae bacterium]|jgi:hypothetical protein
MRTFLIPGSLILLLVVTTACGGGTNPPATVVKPAAGPPLPAIISLDIPFTLQAGQTAVLESETLVITFDTVLRDIRCPSSVQCAESGFARILIVVQSTGQSPVTYDMNSDPFYKANMGLGVNTVSHSGYDIRLAALDPYPQIVDQTIPLEDYRATFVVTLSGLSPTTEPAATPAPLGSPATPVETDEEAFRKAENEYYKGVTYLAAGLPDEAIASFTEAITLYPAHVKAYQFRGDIYRQLRRYDLARADYQQVLTLNPEPDVQATVTTALQEIAQARSVLPTATVTPAPATTSPSPPVKITLGEPFTLKINQRGELVADGLTVELSAVIQDSHCPRQVDCGSSGQAHLIIRIWLTGVEPTTFELNTNPTFNQNDVPYDAYQIRLLSLDPYPETVEPKIRLEDYRATFEVSKK